MEIAQIIHEVGGVCFADFACSAPYIGINMHEDDNNGRYLDAIYFSPHKYLGGPGTSGILVFNEKLYNNTVPDAPGGGTVDWTNQKKAFSIKGFIEEHDLYTDELYSNITTV